MRIKSFKIFESQSGISSVCSYFGISNYGINVDGSIDVNSSVMINSLYLKKMPLKFRNVTGTFMCDNNDLLTLDGSPEIVGREFDCSYNKLTSLKGAPKSVGVNFFCAHNNLKSFEGLPETIGGSLYCDYNPIFEIYCLNHCVEFAELLNEYEVIRDGNKVVETRLRQALEDSPSEFIRVIPEDFKFKYYQVI